MRRVPGWSSHIRQQLWRRVFALFSSHTAQLPALHCALFHSRLGLLHPHVLHLIIHGFHGTVFSDDGGPLTMSFHGEVVGAAQEEEATPPTTEEAAPPTVGGEDIRSRIFAEWTVPEAEEAAPPTVGGEDVRSCAVEAAPPTAKEASPPPGLFGGESVRSRAEEAAPPMAEAAPPKIGSRLSQTEASQPVGTFSDIRGVNGQAARLVQSYFGAMGVLRTLFEEPV